VAVNGVLPAQAANSAIPNTLARIAHRGEGKREEMPGRQKGKKMKEEDGMDARTHPRNKFMVTAFNDRD